LKGITFNCKKNKSQGKKKISRITFLSHLVAQYELDSAGNMWTCNIMTPEIIGSHGSVDENSSFSCC
jgi:hypothetical protein